VAGFGFASGRFRPVPQEGVPVPFRSDWSFLKITLAPFGLGAATSGPARAEEAYSRKLIVEGKCREIGQGERPELVPFPACCLCRTLAAAQDS